MTASRQRAQPRSSLPTAAARSTTTLFTSHDLRCTICNSLQVRCARLPIPASCAHEQLQRVTSTPDRLYLGWRFRGQLPSQSSKHVAQHDASARRVRHVDEPTGTCAREGSHGKSREEQEGAPLVVDTLPTWQLFLTGHLWLGPVAKAARPPLVGLAPAHVRASTRGSAWWYEIGTHELAANRATDHGGRRSRLPRLIARHSSDRTHCKLSSACGDG